MHVTIVAEGSEALDLIRLIGGSNLGFSLGVQANSPAAKTEAVGPAKTPVKTETAAVEVETPPKETAAAKKKRLAAEAEAAKPTVAETPAAPATAPAKTGTDATGGISLDNIRDRIIAYTKAAGPKAAVALVTETTGAAKASAVAEADYPKLAKALDDALEAAAVAG